jgi:hypothetical protein
LLIVPVQKSNIYSDDDWDRVALIQNTNYPKVVDAFGEETFGIGRGYLRGGYRYYFKYSTQEGTLLRFFMSRL